MSPCRALVVLLTLALVAAPAAAADLRDETALAEKHAPVVQLVEQVEECGPGEPYEPLDVDLLLDDESTVALRGPWNPGDLVDIGPSAEDLAGLFEYHLDFPGNALDAGCDYERWVRRLAEDSEPAVYAHVAADPGHPGRLALQYWLFYAFNDFNNTHEGDWEMVQLVFDAPDAEAALEQQPVAIGYSSHEGAERADWGDDKLELVDGAHPVVYPAAGSHANKFTDALYLGSSAEQGVGCDDTRGPHRELHPVVKTIPSDPGAAAAAFPWIGFEGRWGELQKAFFIGPTGPNLKMQWSEPIEWSGGWRDRSYAIPTGGILGSSATDFFCSAVETGSRALVQLLRNPVPLLLALAALLAIAVFAATRTTWRPAAPLRLGRRRTWGQILSAAGRMYVSRLPLFLGIGLLFIPLGLAISALQALLIGGLGLAGVEETGESAGAIVLLLVAVGRPSSSARSAHAVAAWTSWQPLLRALAPAVAVWVALTLTAILTPVAVWLAVRWALLAQVVEIEGLSGRAALSRSAELVRGRWLRVASLVGVGAVLALGIGPFLGAILIFLTSAPLALLNIVAAVVYALAMPFVAVTTTFVYLDARARHELEPADRPSELPAEIELAPARSGR